MHSLALLVDELSSKKDIFFSLQKRQSLKSSAIIAHKVTDFLEYVKKSLFHFDNLCTKDRNHNIELINALGVLMNDLADLYTSVGGETAANEIRKQGDFTQKVVVSFSSSNFTIVLFSLFRRTSTSLEISTFFLLTVTPLALPSWLLTVWMILPGSLRMLEWRICAASWIWTALYYPSHILTEVLVKPLN